MVGVAAKTQHAYTFDGKLVAFNGQCKYVLAHDAVNNNFTVVATYKDRVLTEITLIDQHDQFSINAEGNTLANGGARSFYLPKTLLYLKNFFFLLLVPIRNGDENFIFFCW